MATKLDAKEVVYDLENGIGWLMGSILVFFARPVMWLMFREESEQELDE